MSESPDPRPRRAENKTKKPHNMILITNVTTLGSEIAMAIASAHYAQAVGAGLALIVLVGLHVYLRKE
jgi:hypothetical protein